MRKTMKVMLACLAAGPLIVQAVVDDPIAYWNFEAAGGVLANRAAPNAFLDASVLMGQPAAGIAGGASGLAGDALVLDGASAIRLPYHRDSLGTSFTIALWYWQSTNDTRQCLFQSRDNYSVVFEAAATNRKDVFCSYIAQTVAGSNAVPLQTWCHLAQVFSTSGGMVSLAVYTNGTLSYTSGGVSANAMFETFPVRGIHVGATRSVTLDGGRCFKGMVDDLALWGRALSATDVAELYQRGLAGQPLDIAAPAPSTIPLGGTQRAFALRVGEGVPPGALYNGWLTETVPATNYAYQALDTAGETREPVGSALPDTARHVAGPFDAVKITNMNWRIPMGAAGSPFRQLTATSNFTAEAWFRTTEKNNGVIFGNYTGTRNGVMNLQLEYTGGVTDETNVRFYINKTQDLADRTSFPCYPKSALGINVNNGAWHHLAGVRDGTNLIVYVDGRECGRMATTVGTFELAGSDYYIGDDWRDASHLNWKFDGEIGTSRLWTRTLGTNEIAALAAYGVPGSGAIAQNGLLAEYAPYKPFDAVRSGGTSWYQFELTPRLRQLTLTNFTCEVVYRTTKTGSGILMGNYTGTLGGPILNLELGNNNNGVRMILGNGINADFVRLQPSNLPVNTRDGAWHRLAGLRRDGKLLLFLDGQKLDEMNDPLAPYTLAYTYMGIGRDFRGGANNDDIFLNGDIARARLWNRALTDGELAASAADDDAAPMDGLVARYAPEPLPHSLRDAGFADGRFLRTCTTGTNTVSLTFTGLPRHHKVSLGLLLAQIGALEPDRNGDHFAIRLDGAEIMSAGLGPGQPGLGAQVAYLRLNGADADVQLLRDTLTLGGEDMFISGAENANWNEHVYDLSRLDAFQNIPHTAGTLTLELTGVHNVAPEDESFGVDNIRLDIPAPPGTLISVR